jgi:hypothetical protein
MIKPGILSNSVGTPGLPEVQATPTNGILERISGAIMSIEPPGCSAHEQEGI